MSRRDKEYQIKIKDELEIMKNTPGWKFVEGYLSDREKLLFKKLITGKNDGAGEAQARLKELLALYKWLGMKRAEGVDALKQLSDVNQMELE
jgi:hypothetical protein